MDETKYVAVQMPIILRYEKRTGRIFYAHITPALFYSKSFALLSQKGE